MGKSRIWTASKQFSRLSATGLLVEFFFFQAEDGIRDYKVTEFRRVLFRSCWGRPLLHALAVYPHAALADWERARQHAAAAAATAQLIGEPAFLAYAACSRAAIAQARG